jgi:hypothetical protein
MGGSEKGVALRGSGDYRGFIISLISAGSYINTYYQT